MLVNGIVGQPAQAAGVNVLVRGMAANPGMRFEVTRLNTLAILSQLRKDISASEQGRDSGVIALSYQSEDPILARSVLEQISRAYVHQNVARNSAEAAKRLQFVKRQLPNVRKELDKAQAALTDYQTRTQTLDVTVQNQSLLEPDRVDRLGDQPVAHPAGGPREPLHAEPSDLQGAARADRPVRSAEGPSCAARSRRCRKRSRACSA